MGRQSWKRADLVAAANLHSLHRADDEEVELPNRAKRTLQHLRRARAEWHVARLAVLGIEHDDLVAARVGLRARSPPRGGRTLGERSRVQGQSTEFPHQLGAVGAQIIQHKRRRRTERERCWERYPRHNIRVFRNLRRPRQILQGGFSANSNLPMMVHTSSAVARQRRQNKGRHAQISQIMDGTGRENFDIERRTTSKRARAA